MTDPESSRLPDGIEVFAAIGSYLGRSRTIWRVRVHGKLSPVRYWTREAAVASASRSAHTDLKEESS